MDMHAWYYVFVYCKIIIIIIINTNFEKFKYPAKSQRVLFENEREYEEKRWTKRNHKIRLIFYSMRSAHPLTEWVSEVRVKALGSGREWKDEIIRKWLRRQRRRRRNRLPTTKNLCARNARMQTVQSTYFCHTDGVALSEMNAFYSANKFHFSVFLFLFCFFLIFDSPPFSIFHLKRVHLLSMAKICVHANRSFYYYHSIRRMKEANERKK